MKRPDFLSADILRSKSNMGAPTHVTRCGSPLDVDVLASLQPLVLHSRSDSESVGTEVITLSLDKVGGEGFGPVAVEE